MAEGTAAAGNRLKAVVLGVFGLLDGQSGELALPIGVHTGVNSAGGVLFVPPTLGAQQPSLFQVTSTLSGVLGSLSSAAVPNVPIAYGQLAGWLKLRRGDVTLETGLTRWSDRTGPSTPGEDLQ